MSLFLIILFIFLDFSRDKILKSLKFWIFLLRVIFIFRILVGATTSTASPWIRPYFYRIHTRVSSFGYLISLTKLILTRSNMLQCFWLLESDTIHSTNALFHLSSWNLENDVWRLREKEKKFLSFSSVFFVKPFVTSKVMFCLF